MTEGAATYSVSELNAYVNLLLSLDGNLKSITVRGEISGFKRHPSGHLYFTLKDEKASVRAVMFKYSALRLSFLPKDGLSVNATGHVGLFEKDGSFQLYVDSMESSGNGDLFRQFLALKEELENKSWFDTSCKKSIPYLPACVGVVTSASGAAIADIRKVIGRRFPGMPLKLYPASVQGTNAADEIATAIEKADREKEADVLIVGRGGGSLEDLWAFNEIQVAKAVHTCSIPIISAVGHEIDFSICDFTADVRAATPSAAAELAVPEFRELKDCVLSVKTRLDNSLRRGLSEKKTELQLAANSAVFKNPLTLLNAPSMRLETAWGAVSQKAEKRISDESLRIKVAFAGLKANSPDGILAKGFIFAEHKNGNIIYSAKDLSLNDQLTLHFMDGQADVSVIDTKPQENEVAK